MGAGAFATARKGQAIPLAGKIHAGKRLDQTPSGKAIPGGLQVILLDTDAWKNAYHYRLRQAIEGGSMAAWLHSETKSDYAKQIMAEELRINQKGLQEWVRVKPDNLPGMLRFWRWLLLILSGSVAVLTYWQG